MTLADQQRKLLALLRGADPADRDADPYIRKVASSRDLGEARRNVLLWRVFVLERTCPLTFGLLKERHLVEEVLVDFIRRHNISPFRETQAPMFLEALHDHPDALIVSVSQFELALMRVREGDPGAYVIPWQVDPHTVLHSLAKGLPLAERLPEGAYEIHVSRDLPHRLEIVCLTT